MFNLAFFILSTHRHHANANISAIRRYTKRAKGSQGKTLSKSRTTGGFIQVIRLCALVLELCLECLYSALPRNGQISKASCLQGDATSTQKRVSLVKRRLLLCYIAVRSDKS